MQVNAGTTYSMMNLGRLSYLTTVLAVTKGFFLELSMRRSTTCHLHVLVKLLC
jgi:hypothetical protein